MIARQRNEAYIQQRNKACNEMKPLLEETLKKYYLETLKDALRLFYSEKNKMFSGMLDTVRLSLIRPEGETK